MRTHARFSENFNKTSSSVTWQTFAGLLCTVYDCGPPFLPESIATQSEWWILFVWLGCFLFLFYIIMVPFWIRNDQIVVYKTHFDFQNFSAKNIRAFFILGTFNNGISSNIYFVARLAWASDGRSHAIRHNVTSNRLVLIEQNNINIDMYSIIYIIIILL